MVARWAAKSRSLETEVFSVKEPLYYRPQGGERVEGDLYPQHNQVMEVKNRRRPPPEGDGRELLISARMTRGHDSRWTEEYERRPPRAACAAPAGVYLHSSNIGFGWRVGVF